MIFDTARNTFGRVFPAAAAAAAIGAGVVLLLRPPSRRRNRSVESEKRKEPLENSPAVDVLDASLALRAEGPGIQSVPETVPGAQRGVPRVQEGARPAVTPSVVAPAPLVQRPAAPPPTFATAPEPPGSPARPFVTTITTKVGEHK